MAPEKQGFHSQYEGDREGRGDLSRLWQFLLEYFYSGGERKENKLSLYFNVFYYYVFNFILNGYSNSVKFNLKLNYLKYTFFFLIKISNLNLIL